MFSQVIDLANLINSQGFAVQGGAAGDATGYMIGKVGDINGDGYDDIEHIWQI